MYAATDSIFGQLCKGLPLNTNRTRNIKMQIPMMIFDAEKLDVNPTSRNICSVSVYRVDGSMVLDSFDAEQVVNHFGADSLLDEMGEAAARKYFGIEE
jgi:hypothetical protein